MHSLRLFGAGLLLAALVPQAAAAQALDPTFSAPTGLYAPGTTYALGPQQADGKRLVAGFFTRVNGTTVSNLVRLDAAGALDVPFAQNASVQGYIYQIKALPTGQYLLCGNGSFLTAGGVNRTELLRLNANGTGDGAFDAGAGPNSLAGYGYGQGYAVQPDGKILVAGFFDSFNNAPAAAVVRLNANGSVDPSFSVGTGIDVNGPTYPYANAVAVLPSGKVMVGGYFESFNGQPAPGLVRLNANGTLDTSFSAALEPGSEVQSLTVQPDGNVLATGYIQLAGGNSAGLVRLLPSGAIDAGFSAPTFLTYNITNYADTPVVLQPDGKILVVGYFIIPGAHRVTRLNANGSQDLGFQVGAATGPSDGPTTVGLQPNGSVLVGGPFNIFNGTETPLGQLSSTGAPDLAFAPKLQVPGSVAVLARQPDGKLVLGGNFTELNGQPVHRLARLTAAGTPDAAFMVATGVLPSPVTCLALQPDGKVLAGTGRGLLRFGASGSPDPTFATTYPTTALALQPDGKIMLAGPFNAVAPSGSSYGNLVRLTSTGALDPGFFRPNANSVTGTANTSTALLVQPDGRVVAGGSFRPMGSQSAPIIRVVRYESTGALDPTFNNLSAFTTTAGTSTFSNRISALALQADGKILVGGNFGAVDGALRNGVARLTAGGTPDAGFAPSSLLNGAVLSLALQPNGRVLLGGNFTSAGASASLNYVARVLGNGQDDASFANTAAPNNQVRALLVQPDGAIVLAGGFTAVAGQPRVGVARITAPNVLAVAAPAAVVARTAAWPVPAHGRLHVAPDASAHPLTVELLDAVGRAVRAQTASAPELTLDVEGLPAGVYLLRVNYAAGSVSRRVVVE